MFFARLKDIFINAADNTSAFISSRVQTLKNTATTFASSVKQTEGSIATGVSESLKDLWAAIRHDEAMPAHQRHLDEFKIIVGGAATGIGAIEANPLFAGSGAIPAWEGILEMEKAGHKWRAKHPSV